MKNTLKLIIDAFKIAINKSKSDWNQDDESQPNYIKNRPFYDSTGWIQTTLIDDDWSTKSTCKFESTPVEWSENGFYKVRVDGVEYQFNGMESTYISTLNKVVFYIGAEYVLNNSAIDYGTYPFCFVTDDFVNKNIYAVFPDKTMNHVVEFYAEEIIKIDEKYIPDNIPKVSAASVDQLLSVKEVDENGVPTKWKAIDQCVTSYKYLDRLQETDTHVLFCVDLDNPKYLTYIMPKKYASIHIYKDGVKVSGADSEYIYHSLRLDSFDDSRVFIMADNGCGTIHGYFYYFSTGWSKKTYTTNLDALEYEFLHLENEREYIPVGDYNPATKKYVDDLGNTYNYENLNTEDKTLVGAINEIDGEIPTKLSDLENDLDLEVEGTVEITSGEPTKESTVMTLNPNAEEVHLYTAEEIDAMFDAFINAEEVAY